jgi:hypothetical protein
VRIVRIHIENFRGISLADIYLNGTSVFLGDNNTGKSTVFEAIELAIGADRLSRMQAIDEHDFHGGRYLAEGDQPRKIVIEVVIAGLQCGGEFLCFPTGHPLHPMLITLPIGLFVATFLFDLIIWQAGTEHWATTNALRRRGQV